MRSALLAWYGQNRRRLPWRGDPPPYNGSTAGINSAAASAPAAPAAPASTPATPVAPVSAYGVWVSEIMCQQTRVEAVCRPTARTREARTGARSSANGERRTSPPRAPTLTPAPAPTPTVGHSVLARVDGSVPDGRSARRGGRGGGQRALGGAGLLPAGPVPARGKPAGAPAAPPQLPPSSTFLLHHRLCAARAAFRGTKERTTAHTPVLHACVVQVVADFGGVVPTTVDELMSPALPVRKESARPVPWRGGGSQGREVVQG